MLSEFVEEITNRNSPVQSSVAVRASEIVLSERDQVLDKGFVAVAKVEGGNRGSLAMESVAVRRSETPVKTRSLDSMWKLRDWMEWERGRMAS